MVACPVRSIFSAETGGSSSYFLVGVRKTCPSRAASRSSCGSRSVLTAPVRHRFRLGDAGETRQMGAEVLRREFDSARRISRCREVAEGIASARQHSLLVGSSTSRTHACGLAWTAQHRTLIAIVTPFNETTYAIRSRRSEWNEWASVSFESMTVCACLFQDSFDPISKEIGDVTPESTSH
jgi:hypothetical protein